LNKNKPVYIITAASCPEHGAPFPLCQHTPRHALHSYHQESIRYLS